MIEPGGATAIDLGAEVVAHYGDPTAELEAMRAGVGIIDRTDAGFLVVTGADTFSFLDSLISAEVVDLADGSGVHSLLLSPKGKLVADFRLIRVGDEAWIDTETGLAGTMAAALGRYRIRVDVEISERSDECGTLQLRGPGVDDSLGGVGAPRPSLESHAHVAWGAARVVRVERPGDRGVDILGNRATLASIWEALTEAGAVRVGRRAAEAHRIAAGVPRQRHDIDETTIPQEAGLELDAVSFTKGCFLGQELVCRIDSRGRVNRFLRLLAPSGPLPPVGAEILVDDAPVGTVTSVATVGPSPLVLGYVHRKVDPPGPVRIRLTSGDADTHAAGAETVSADVAALPGMAQSEP